MRKVSRSAVLPKAVVSSLALALALGACGPEESDDSAAPDKSSDTSESTGGSSGGDSGGDADSPEELAKNRRNWVPSNQAGEKEELDFKLTAEGKTVSYSANPLGVVKGKKTDDGRVTWMLYATVTYKSGEGSLLSAVPRGFRLYSDKKTPEKWTEDTGIPDVRKCLDRNDLLENEKLWNPQSSFRICIPFVLPEEKNPEVKNPEDSSKVSYHVGHLEPNANPPHIAVVWNTDGDIRHYEPS